jgi:SagB-type dehydrogenase family enzyme
MDAEALLSEALQKRRSIRSFQPTPLDAQQLSDLLQAAGGVTKVIEDESGNSYLFTNPTASNHQEVEIYVFDADGVYRYHPIGHQLEEIRTDDCRKELGKIPFFKKAPLSLCLVSNVNKMVHHTDEQRRNLYSSMDIGYVSQNIYLHCAAHRMATVACGMIDRQRIAELLGLKNERVMLVHPIGIRKKD